ncbi:MAG TPA: serine/threonine-protein kinase [Kofleriaceae bacterium]|nr:serine/threonine-protein kinase [Kofleriaceae bacterium]
MRDDRDPAVTATSSDDGATATSNDHSAMPRAGTDMPSLDPGAHLDRFEVLGKLGEGGMGVVVSAYDPTLERKVAIKLLRAGTGNPATRTRLLREAQAMARVPHEAIVEVHEVGAADGRIYVVMELVEGETLARWQKARGWREVLATHVRAGRGLAAAHAAGLVHRDFKPANVLVGDDGRVRVTDFGLVAASGDDHDHDEEPSALQVELTRTGDVMGTPAYMAPEQYRGKAADARADQFSFCVGLWEGLYGVRPYDAKTAGDRKARVLAGELGAAPSGRGVPAWIEPILRRGLAPEPDARWPSMDALLDALAADPEARRSARVRTAIIIGTAILLGATVTIIGMVLARRGGAAPCQVAHDLDGVWDAPRRDAIARAFAATGAGYAADTTARVEKALDARTSAWLAMRRDACEATAIEKTQSAELLDRRMACLDRRRDQLRATIELFESDAKASLAHAVDAVGALPPVEDCDATHALAIGEAPPGAAPAIASIRRDLDRAGALIRAGRAKDAREPAARAASAARALAWPPLTAEALAVDARARLMTIDTRTAEPELREAITAATAAGDPAQVAHLTVVLVEVAERDARYDDVATLGKLADAQLGDADERWADRASLETELGRAAMQRRALDDAHAHFERALALRRKHAGASSLDAAHSLQDEADLSLHSARWADADALLHQVLAIKEHALGPNHPELATTLSNLSIAAKELEHYDDGAADLRRAIAIVTDAEGADSPRLATLDDNLGVILGYQGKGEEALATIKAGLAIRERVLPPDHPELASSVMNVGITLQESLGRPAEAIPYFERARDMIAKKLGPDHPDLAYPLHGLGSSYLDLKQPARGVADLSEAYRIRSQPKVDPQLEADSGYMLAQALYESSKPGSAERARAHALLIEAAKIYRDLGSPDGAAVIDAWAKAHP